LLHGKTAMVTGTSRKIGIGAAIARGLAEEGANVCLVYWPTYDRQMPWGSNSEDILELQADIRASGVQCHAWEADLSLVETPGWLFDAAIGEFGHVDILVNNAAISINQDLYALTAEAIDQVYRVNVRGTLLLTAEFARRHDGRSGGRIINMTSGQGADPMPTELPYAASKAAIEAFTRSASVTLAQTHITVNAVDPGATDSGWMTPTLAQELRRTHPRGRVGLPADAANLVVFLASEKGTWVSGQVLRSRGAA
jgi:3-oxoacyl-[acyl-carrier protein] reductase